MSTELTRTARPAIIGLTGKMGAGKDMVLTRLQHLFGDSNYRKASFADPLKRSAAALFNVELNMLEAWKNEPTIRVSVLDLRGAGRDLGRSFSIREVLQRYGTEAHRDIFGENFWVQAAMHEVAQRKIADGDARTIDVFTDVRFENEAQAIVDLGGIVYEVEGPERPGSLDGIAQREAAHQSESGIPFDLIYGTISNTHRPDYTGADNPVSAQEAMDASLAILDDEVAIVHAELMELAR